MNAGLHQIFSAMTSALAVATTGPTASDLFAWEREQSPRPYKNIEFAMRNYGIGLPDRPLVDVKRKLAREICREQLKASHVPVRWDYDAGRYSDYLHMQKVIEAFEASRVVAREAA